MEMVATTKLRRFQDRALASRPYAGEIAQLLERLATALGDRLADRPLFKVGAGEATAVLLVSSDRGLCGAYNSQLFAALELWMREHEGRQLQFYVYGRRGYQYLKKRGLQVERYLAEPALETVDYRLAKYTAKTLTEAFLAGTCRDVVLFYTAFESMVRYVPTTQTLLPVRPDLKSDQAQEAGDVILEPTADALLEKLMPRYLETRVYNALLESITSEYASRRMSMKNATDAASDMQTVLKGIYNRKRQEGITKDLLDIVGGAEALR